MVLCLTAEFERNLNMIIWLKKKYYTGNDKKDAIWKTFFTVTTQIWGFFNAKESEGMNLIVRKNFW